MSLVSSQLLLMLCSTGYLRVRMPRLLWAPSPTVAILLLHAHHDAPVSGTTDHGLEHGRGGASSPAKPALHVPESLWMTSGQAFFRCGAWRVGRSARGGRTRQ